MDESAVKKAMEMVKKMLRERGDGRDGPMVQSGVLDDSIAMRNLMSANNANKAAERGALDGIAQPGNVDLGIPGITLSPVVRQILEDKLVGISRGLRLGYGPEGFGMGATVGREITASPEGVRTGPIRGVDLQHKSGDQQMGVGVHHGDRGNRWAIQYRNKF